ncbi:F-box/WD repeat-containing protein 7-like isoform X3 [Scyliorhinus canicula]|uniref:F-box/WD repeat-containing protein 7-like isoform X3 n=1 Tax=Scyliorhinus canicula TaxID=7830 RepID=UPI0018F3A947|nr:F-box/WD repeat-containing protein 7-like isoform X3 [Scyliorhinus canicula]
MEPSPLEEKMDLICSAFASLDVKEQDQVLSRLLRVCQLPQLKVIYTELCPLLSIDFVLILPQELVERIFSFVSAEDLFKIACCSRSWREFTNTDVLWHPLCAAQNWLNFDTDQQLFSMNQYSYSPTGLTSPRYSTTTLSDFPSLSPTCRWKEIYIRACHLNQNWSLGRYTVLPLLRGHQERVDCLDCDETGICLRALMGHNSGIDHLCFDGTQVVSASSDRTIRVWSIQDGRCKKILRGHEDEIQYLAMKEQIVASTSWDHTIRMWNIQRGECTAVLKGHTEVVNCCQFDCQYVVSGGGDCLVLIWSTDSGKLLCTCQGHTGDVYCLMFNEKTICSGSSDSTIRVWDFTGNCLFTMAEHIGVVRCLHLYGNRLVSGGDRKKILVWDVANGKLVNAVHRNPSLLHKIWVNETKVITASPESPGILTILSYWCIN